MICGTARPANSSGVKRHMIKFLFNRASENTAPSWNHDPDALNQPRDWDARDKAQMPSTSSLLATLSASRRATITRSGPFARRAGKSCWGTGRQIEARRCRETVAFLVANRRRQQFYSSLGRNCCFQEYDPEEGRTPRTSNMTQKEVKYG